jgi:hypothetical protein
LAFSDDIENSFPIWVGRLSLIFVCHVMHFDLSCVHQVDRVSKTLPLYGWRGV